MKPMQEKKITNTYKDLDYLDKYTLLVTIVSKDSQVLTVKHIFKHKRNIPMKKNMIVE